MRSTLPRTQGSAIATIGYSYDTLTGELVSMTYPSGSMLTLTRDQAGQISAIQFGGQPLATAIRRLPFGPVKSASLGSLTLTRDHDQRYQISAIQAGAMQLNYTRDAAGQVTAITGIEEPTAVSGTETIAIDPNSNRMTAATYDASGNLTSDGVRVLTWDALNRLIKVEQNGTVIATYGYDSQNRRIRKTVGSKTILYHYCKENLLIAETLADGTTLREYVYLDGEPLALREYETNPGLYYYLNDHLGTPQQLVKPDGTSGWKAAYLPYGQAQVKVGAVTNNLRFPGQYFDAETGLHYNLNRYYDPTTGRYTSADPIGLRGGMNLYSYVQNNPINAVDPRGLEATIPWGTIISGATTTVATPVVGIIVTASSIILGMPSEVADATLEGNTDKKCDDDPCKQHEKVCVGTAKAVETHNYGTSSASHHMHPGICSNLADKINKANAAGCGDRLGVIYAKGVFNTVCSRDWSDQYPNNTPKFPSYE